MNYERLLSFGDLIKLNIRCKPEALLNEVKDFEWARYNPRKNIKRYGLSITSLDGKINGIDLDSLYQYNEEHGTTYDEIDFNKTTNVYDMSEEIQKIVDPFIDHIGRSHILNLRPGGFFPAHRDMRYSASQLSCRIIVPLRNCNPPQMYFMYEDTPLQFEHGSAYFLNTNKFHSVFSMQDSYFIVLNVICNKDSHKVIMDNLYIN